MFRNPYADGLIVLLIVLLFFGPKRLPHLGRSLGEGMKEFKDSITGNHKEPEAAERPELTQATAAPQAAPTAEAAPAAAQRSAEVDSNA
jgi:sec-independent protein translocase protein TatA